MTTKRCADCCFKFETAKGGGNAKVCPSCRQARKVKWRKDQEEMKNFQVPEKAAAAPRKSTEATEQAIKKIVERTHNEPTPDSDKIQGF